jgi:putative holliday junction resolvase
MNKPTRIVSIDYGLARIGVALSDETKIIASPFSTVKAERKSERNAEIVYNELKRLEKEKGCVISTLVIGLPLKMNGTMGMQADEVKAFAGELQKRIDTPIVFWDERLTTVQATRAMEGMSRKQRVKSLDNIAATIILQSYLDSPRLQA